MKTARRRWWAAACGLVLCAVLSACRTRYRVGDYVWVKWDGKNYPAYILAKRSRERYRVHYDGFDSRWDENVDLDRIEGRIHGGPVTPPPLPAKVARAEGLSPSASASAARGTSYRVGEHVHVMWRGASYPAIIIELLSPTRFRVHYRGYETAFDEVVTPDRIVSRR